MTRRRRGYALLMGSTLKIDDSMPPITIDERDNNLSLMKERLTTLGADSFLWPGSPKTGLKICKNPLKHRVMSAIENAFDKAPPKPSDLFLFYYFGHGCVGPSDRLILAFANQRMSSTPEEFALHSVLEKAQLAGFKKAILIVDCCYAGVPANSRALHVKGIEHFLISSTDNGWAEKGRFTEALAAVLRPPRSKQLRIRGQDVITFEKWFEVAARRLVNVSQAPVCAGTLGAEVLTSFDLVVAAGFNDSAPTKSLYNKLYCVLGLLGKGSLTVKQLHQELGKSKHPAFMVVTYENGVEQRHVVSEYKLREYLLTAMYAGLARSAGDSWSLTSKGTKAVADEGAVFNRELVAGVFRWLKPTGLSRSELNKLLYELAKEAILPTVAHVMRSMLMNGFVLMRRKHLRTALRILAYAGVIQRAVPDTYFPR